MLEFRTHHSIREFPVGDWDRLATPTGVPYLRWAFLDALESTNCAHPEAGWAPAHISLREEGELVAVLPAYVKGNSDGEFIFDHSWANFSYQRLAHEYYPKLVVACPFTPATGPRLLYRSGADVTRLTRGVANGLERLTEQLGLSGAHVLFPRADESAELEAAGMLRRYGLQYHWTNAGYETFEDFLARYSSKRRTQIRRERKELLLQGLELRTVTGTDLTSELIDHAYEFYRCTVDKYYWGRQYLNREFFHEVCSRMPDDVLLVLAYDRSRRRYVAGAFNLLGRDRLYGRYWGATEERKYLHFNVCYYAGIDECIARRLSVFEPGAGGEHKLARGFEPTLTFSNHILRHPVLKGVVSEFLERERDSILASIAEQPTLLKARI